MWMANISDEKQSGEGVVGELGGEEEVEVVVEGVEEDSTVFVYDVHICVNSTSNPQETAKSVRSLSPQQKFPSIKKTIHITNIICSPIRYIRNKC